jgi:hypothetical protein
VREKEKEKAKSGGELANGVEALNIDDKPAAKSKGLDVLKEFEKSGQKKAANFVVIGMLLRRARISSGWEIPY